MYQSTILKLEQSDQGNEHERLEEDVPQDQLLVWAGTVLPEDHPLPIWRTTIAFLQIDEGIIFAREDGFLKQLVTAFGYEHDVLECAAGGMCKTARIWSTSRELGAQDTMLRAYRSTHLNVGVIWIWNPMRRCTKGLMYVNGRSLVNDETMRWARSTLERLKQYRHLRTNPMLLGLLRYQDEVGSLEKYVAKCGRDLTQVHVDTELHDFTGLKVKNGDLGALSAAACSAAMDISKGIIRLQAAQRLSNFVQEETRSLGVSDFEDLSNPALLQMVLISSSSIALIMQDLDGSMGYALDESRRLQWDAEILVQSVFTLTNQKEQKVNTQLARDTKALAEQATKDGNAMKAIAAVTMFFLPGTFVAVSLSCRRSEPSESSQRLTCSTRLSSQHLCSHST